MTNENKSLIAFNLSYLFNRTDLLKEAMQNLMAWVGEDRIKAPSVQRYRYDEVADAHRALESGNTVGKLILKFGEYSTGDVDNH